MQDVEPHGAVIVTGANGGVGSAIALELSLAGYQVIAIDLQSQKVEAACFIQEDLSAFVLDESRRQGLGQEIRAWLKRNELPLVGIVNNAAVQILDSTEDLTLGDFEETLRINLTAPLMLTQLFLPELRKSKGAVVNIGSIHARLTKPGFVSYATSKSALRGLTQALAVDLGAQGIRINAIEPAALNTEMLRDGFRHQPDAIKELQAYHPAGRIGEPKEVAKIVVFLLSAQCQFMTGSVLSADGAISVRLHDPN